MLIHDMHVHSIRSQCGTMTYGEIVARALTLGMRSIAITDHALAFGVNRFVFHILVKRFPERVDGIRVYRGIEANVVDEAGNIDIPPELVDRFDWIALGMHPVDGCLRGRDRKTNTNALLAALERHPWIDVVVHPTQRSHDLDFSRVLPVLASLGIAMEVNDCGHRYGKAEPERTADVLRRAVQTGVPVVASSDAHVFHEVGEDASIRDVFQQAQLDPAIAVNADGERLAAFVDRHCALRRAAVAEGG